MFIGCYLRYMTSHVQRRARTKLTIWMKKCCDQYKKTLSKRNNASSPVAHKNVFGTPPKERGTGEVFLTPELITAALFWNSNAADSEAADAAIIPMPVVTSYRFMLCSALFNSSIGIERFLYFPRFTILNAQNRTISYRRPAGGGGVSTPHPSVFSLSRQNGGAQRRQIWHSLSGIYSAYYV